MLSRQEVNTMRHLANAQYWDRPAGGNTGRLFLAFGGPVCADRFSNCPLDRVLTYKNLIYLLNLQFSVHTLYLFYDPMFYKPLLYWKPPHRPLADTHSGRELSTK